MIRTIATHTTLAIAMLAPYGDGVHVGLGQPRVPWDPVARAQSASTTASATPDSESIIVARIREQYQRINRSLASCRTRTLTLENVSLEGAEVKAYWCAGQIVRVDVWYAGEGGRHREEYYWSDGHPIFLYTVDETYRQPIGVGKLRIAQKNEDRFYVSSDRVVRWIDKFGHVHSGTKEDLASESARTLKNAANLLRRANGDSTAALP